MHTLDALCAEMQATGRHLSPRAARDWWTKGLLPRPQRHGLGRGKGTVTFWTEPRVSQQARAAHDLLAAHARTDTALLSLWLLGFPIDLRSIRASYQKVINDHLGLVHRHPGCQPDDVVGKFAATLARQYAKTSGAPADVRQALAELAVDFLEVVYIPDNEIVIEGLSELWEKVAPYIGGGASCFSGFADLHLHDENLGVWLCRVKEMASLPAQQTTIARASDHELMRARRLIIFVFGNLRRIARAAACQDDCEKFGRQLLVVIGRTAVPILVAVLRQDAFRHKIMSSLLEVVHTLRSSDKWIAPNAQSLPRDCR